MTAFDFNDLVKQRPSEELLQAVVSPDNYQEAFVAAAEAELGRRGTDLEPYLRQRTHRQRFLDGLRKPEEAGSEPLIAAGFISALLGGPVGILIGYHFRYARQRIAGVEEGYRYRQRTRSLGEVMMVIGSVVFFALLVSRFTGA
ncbi:hypothetical protein [Flaviaesturariibacter amylovorans]|uniref:DUF4190 domain-containing protein n=1 Tax=Flaviaesturariibacter amylovorans TaxID=1084520 RepID=A0ABP8HD35_9BACT